MDVSRCVHVCVIVLIDTFSEVIPSSKTVLCSPDITWLADVHPGEPNGWMDGSPCLPWHTCAGSGATNPVVVILFDKDRVSRSSLKCLRFCLCSQGLSRQIP